MLERLRGWGRLGLWRCTMVASNYPKYLGTFQYYVRYLVSTYFFLTTYMYIIEQQQSLESLHDNKLNCIWLGISLNHAKRKS